MERTDRLWPDGPVFYFDDALFAPGTDSFAAEFIGAGTVVFDIYVNGSYHSTITLEFVDG